ncbi:AbgT family transporter [Priestia flexa]|uniref:AbgT family transporter n=1 Tax=Priestia flexa TaxID=86664 RepID=UPI00077C2E5B|nr:AbgT family transporter [Priestia flexa]MCP1189910.1 AbgT family transporter [Priestia flexa]MED4589041.1 AbgT family transporter [Priestia flexa]WHX77774.1 AbgT family transporter [Priestia flexa]
MNPEVNQVEKKGVILRVLDSIERVGNKLPHPAVLFVIFAMSIMAVSWIVSVFDVTTVHPGTGEELPIRNMFSKEGIQFIFTSMLSNFTEFQPLGLVLAMMLGIGVADKVGLIETFIKKTIINAPKSVITYAIVFAGVLGNLAADAAFVIIPPLAATIFYTLGRHPFAGLAAGFAGVGAGFSANLVISGNDALLSGIANEVVKTVSDTATVTPVDNWFFNAASVALVVLVGGLVTEKIIEPRLGTYKGNKASVMSEVSNLEAKGLRNAGIVGFLYIGMIVMMTVPKSGLLRSDEGTIIPSPFLDGIVPITLIFFLLIGMAYGFTVGNLKSISDVPNLMAESMKDMAGFIVLIFAASQFIAYFNWTNIGTWIAVSGAEILTGIGLTGLPVIIGFIFLTAVLNLFIFSGSAQWALMAPIFIPMLMLLDYHPAYVQMAYRIADSSTNVITPLNPYFPIILALMKDYDKRSGIGSLISLMLPYSVVILVTWTLFFLIWNLLGLPIGPGIEMFINK